MPITYQTRNGIEYATMTGKSVRKNNGSRSIVTKDFQIYLGRVIDKKNHVFCNRQRGVYTFDEDTLTYGIADPKYSSELKQDGRKREKLVLDFGDVYFLKELLHKMEYDKVIESVDYGNRDTLEAMVMFYVLTEYACSHAQTWYNGSFAKILYPNANLTSQRLSDFMKMLGDETRQRNYFKAHIEWLQEKVCNDSAIIVDSTGLPNAIDTYLTGISNHNGKISREIRMTSAVQRDSGYPLLYRLVPGNVIDTSTLSRTVLTLEEYNVKTDLALLDAGYYSDKNIDELCGAGLDFVSRLPERNTVLYYEVMSKCRDELRRPENLVTYNGRSVYIKSTEVKIGSQKQYEATAYLGLDTGRMTDEIHKAQKNLARKKTTAKEMHNIIENAGLFILISTVAYQDEEILPVYYTRQLVEQYFDVGKGISRLIPLRVHSKESVLGHLMLSQMAATINLYIQKKMLTGAENREDILLALRNQKCIVYKNRIITTEPQSGANAFYDKFGIKCPESFKRNGSEITPQFGLKQPSYSA